MAESRNIATVSSRTARRWDVRARRISLNREDDASEPPHGNAPRSFETWVFHADRHRRRLADVNIRSIVAPTLSRYPTEYQWEELEELLRRALSQMPRQTIPEALADEPALSVIEEWRHRHWLDESASFLP